MFMPDAEYTYCDSSRSVRLMRDVSGIKQVVCVWAVLQH